MPRFFSKQCGSCAGNSGGPAFADLQQAKVAGVAFSKLSNADNVGYIIPYQIIKHFLQVCNLLSSSACQFCNSALSLLYLTSSAAEVVLATDWAIHNLVYLS